MTNKVIVTEKYERHGWPSVDRPDLKPPDGWSLALVNSVNLIHHHALSPDGTEVAFVWERDGRSDIFVQPIAGGWPRRVSPDRGRTIYWWDSPPQWSPDGRWLAFAHGGHVCVAPADGRGLPRTLTDFADAAWSPVWLPDSHRLIVTAQRRDAFSLLLTDRGGSWPRSLADDNGGDNGEAAPSPDGQRVAYIHRPFDDLNRWELRLIDITNGQTATLFGRSKEKAWSPRWSPDGQQVYFLSQQSGWTEVWAVRPDGDGLHQLTQLGRDVAELALCDTGIRALAAMPLPTEKRKEGQREVAVQLTRHDSLATHLRDELGIQDHLRARPVQAALASAAAFTMGAMPPVLLAWLWPGSGLAAGIVACTLVLLAVLGYIAERIAGGGGVKGALRVLFWGALAQGATALIGHLFGVATA